MASSAASAPACAATSCGEGATSLGPDAVVGPLAPPPAGRPRLAVRGREVAVALLARGGLLLTLHDHRGDFHGAGAVGVPAAAPGCSAWAGSASGYRRRQRWSAMCSSAARRPRREWVRRSGGGDRRGRRLRPAMGRRARAHRPRARRRRGDRPGRQRSAHPRRVRTASPATPSHANESSAIYT